MPALFIGHGNPMNALEENQYTSTWQSVGRMIPRPRAVLCISAHWFSDRTAVTATARPETIHDFRGFPHMLSDYRYAAPGSPELAQQVANMLGTSDVALDGSRGLDHGCWSVLTHMFPEVDVPIVQLSMNVQLPFEDHYRIGAQLSRLRDEGVLILGSGNVVHNLRALRMDEKCQPYPWAMRIEKRIAEYLESEDHGPLLDISAIDPEFRFAIPSPDHYVPLMYIIGTQRADEKINVFLKGIDLASVSMLSFAVGALRPPA